jgi:hypothetical protein
VITWYTPVTVSVAVVLIVSVDVEEIVVVPKSVVEMEVEVCVASVSGCSGSCGEQDDVKEGGARFLRMVLL